MSEDVTARLAAIRERNEHLRSRYGYVGGLLALTGAKDDVPRLLAAVEAALKDNRKSMFPAGPPGAGNAYGKHYCAGICCTSIDDQVIYRVWPCQPYQYITAALSGTGKEGSEDG